MSNLSFSIEQRNKEIQQTQKILAIGLVGSVAVHAAIALAIVGLYEEPTIADNPIELIIVEDNSSVPEIPEPPENKPQPVTPPKPTKVTTSTPKTEESNSGGGQQQPLASAPTPPQQQLRSSPIPQTPSPPQPRPSLQPQPAQTPTTPDIPTETPPPTATSTPLPLTSPQQSQSILDDPSPSSPNIAAADTRPNNPVGDAPSIGSAPTTLGRVSPLSGNSQGGNPFGTGLGGTSSGSSGDGGSGTGSGGGVGSGTNPGIGSAAVATRSAPPKPTSSPNRGEKEGIRCISECQPDYPSVLNGVEGSAGVQIVVDANGNGVSFTLSKPHSNAQINQQALLAARKMKFTAPPNGERASVQINVNFTVAGSEFDRRAREMREQQQRQRQAQEQERKERQAQLEQERQERQRQLELERQQRERQVQLERERQQQQERQIQPEPTQQQQQPPQPPQPTTEIERPIEPLQPSPTDPEPFKIP
ncbi:TonB family protein [Gloeothece citriformis PCC 7424]|uniref:TonB family protein n=1 Tax=Gloeothece citriformis (strain PCC 7424) TaxID=65393 RepID=B7KIX5_GLOC7|nr:energy transducer TonB [Gloeothece citriformis]ACK70811.1 TonB family protein [Gloeothece citriformis PCC 7424]